MSREPQARIGEFSREIPKKRKLNSRENWRARQSCSPILAPETSEKVNSRRISSLVFERMSRAKKNGTSFFSMGPPAHVPVFNGPMRRGRCVPKAGIGEPTGEPNFWRTNVAEPPFCGRPSEAGAGVLLGLGRLPGLPISLPGVRRQRT